MTQTRPTRLLAHATGALLLTLGLGACATTPTRSGSPVLQGKLNGDYAAWHDPATGELTVRMEWPVRFGRTVAAVGLSKLDLDKATVEPVTGGAFKFDTLVRIPANPPNAITLKRWNASPDEKLAPDPDHVGSTSTLHFHSPSDADARSALRELRHLARRQGS